MAGCFVVVLVLLLLQRASSSWSFLLGQLLSLYILQYKSGEHVWGTTGVFLLLSVGARRVNDVGVRIRTAGCAGWDIYLPAVMALRHAIGRKVTTQGGPHPREK